MALDLAALRAKLNELKGNQAKSEILWKPTEGENRIRIIPLSTNADNPFIELYFHYLGSKTYLSPLSFGERDPIAEFAEKLTEGGGLTKEEWKETRKFIPQRRTFVPIIDRKKPELGVRFWAFGKTVYTDLLNVMADPEYGDITDVQSGRDVKVIFTPQEKSDTNFAKTSITMAANSSPLTKNAEELHKWLSEQPDVLSVYKRMTYDELKDVLSAFLDPKSAASTQAPQARTVKTAASDDWDTENSPTTSPTAEKAKPASSKVSSDVEDEFAKLFNS
jgi:hypothetical protein